MLTGRSGLPAVEPEIERVLAISEPVLSVDGHRVHFVGDILYALLNLRQWNHEMATPEGRILWGKWTVTYFVLDPHSGTFAPSKFCAYLPVAARTGTEVASALHAGRPKMTIELYARLDGHESRFDAHRAQRHLVEALAMARRPIGEEPGMAQLFDRWLERHREAVQVHPSGPVVLVPTAWFR